MTTKAFVRFWALTAAISLIRTSFAASSPPQVEITSGAIRARLYLPDGATGFYRGTRFDWSGIIDRLEYAGHDYYPAWFQRMEPSVRDFIYDGPDIVAGPCTAITGPAEEFAQPLGFEEAKAGGTFVKVGVGALRKPAEGKYDPFQPYEIVDGGTWTVQPNRSSVEFSQELPDAGNGYSYEYRKTVSLSQHRPQLALDHRLRNTGKRPIRTSVYNHNFLYLDRQPPGPEITIGVPFSIQTSQPPDTNLVQIQGSQIRFAKTLANQDRVYLTIRGFSVEPKDYDIRVDNQALGAGVRVTADRPLSRLALWSIRAPLSVEPFIDVAIDPGQEFTWRVQYEYYTLGKKP